MIQQDSRLIPIEFSLNILRQWTILDRDGLLYSWHNRLVSINICHCTMKYLNFFMNKLRGC